MGRLGSRPNRYSRFRKSLKAKLNGGCAEGCRIWSATLLLCTSAVMLQAGWASRATEVSAFGTFSRDRRMQCERTSCCWRRIYAGGANGIAAGMLVAGSRNRDGQCQGRSYASRRLGCAVRRRYAHDKAWNGICSWGFRNVMVERGGVVGDLDDGSLAAGRFRSWSGELGLELLVDPHSPRPATLVTHPPRHSWGRRRLALGGDAGQPGHPLRPSTRAPCRWKAACALTAAPRA